MKELGIFFIRMEEKLKGTIRGKGNEYFRHTREHESEDYIM
jgi:hypothetical protein